MRGLLLEKRASIFEKWFDLILSSYPPDTEKFLRSQKDPFANPVGHSIKEGIEGLIDVAFSGVDAERASASLDRIIRVRAVQDFTASGAVAFVFVLKRIIRDELDAGARSRFHEELSELDMRIDTLALMAFDIYMKCREKVYDLKATEARDMTFRLLQRANLLVGKEPAAPAGNDKE